MLYRITDVNGAVIGVHECAPSALRGYLDSLPNQTAPYTGADITLRPKTLMERASSVLYHRSMLDGLIVGSAGTGILSVAGYLALRHFGVAP